MKSMLSPTFIIGKIHIGTVEGASSVSFGNNLTAGFQSYTKHNQGFGDIKGDHNSLEGIHSILQDQDLEDLFASSKEELPPWLKEEIEKRLQAAPQEKDPPS
jgi:hypothetical protein